MQRRRLPDSLRERAYNVSAKLALPATFCAMDTHANSNESPCSECISCNVESPRSGESFCKPQACQGFTMPAIILYEVSAHVSPYTNGIACHVLNPNAYLRRFRRRGLLSSLGDSCGSGVRTLGSPTGNAGNPDLRGKAAISAFKRPKFTRAHRSIIRLPWGTVGDTPQQRIPGSHSLCRLTCTSQSPGTRLEIRATSRPSIFSQCWSYRSK